MLLEVKCSSIKVQEGLNEKKLGAIIVLLIASVAPAMILGGYVANAVTPSHHGHPPGLVITNRCLIINTANLNASYAIWNLAENTDFIDQLKIVIGNTELTSFKIYVNESLIDCTNKPLFTIQPKDTAQVNIIVPYVSNPYALSALQDNGNVTEVRIYTPKVFYGAVCNLNN